VTGDLPAVERKFIALLPGPFRARAALRTAGHVIRKTYPGSRAIVKVRRKHASVDLRGSLFCEVRDAAPEPLCGFYAAIMGWVLQYFSVPAEIAVKECRGSGPRRGCTFTIDLEPKAGDVSPNA
jgi:hypothetical protein